jgi:hypothetical protein
MTASTRSEPRAMRAAAGLAFALACVAACGKSEEAPAPWGGGTTDGGSPFGSGGRAGAGGSAGTGGSTSSGTGGANGTGGSSTGGASGTGGAAGGTGGSIEPSDGGTAMDPHCSQTVVWASEGRTGSLATADFARFGGVSADELTVSFTATNGDPYVADRVSAHDAFTAPVKITGTFAPDRVALAPTGLELVAVAANRTSLLGFAREDRSLPWVASSGLQFTRLQGLFEGDATISEPVLGADKRSLFFLLSPGAGQTPVLYESKWDTSARAWNYPASIPAVKSEDATHRRRPTGASADALTLFFFDEVASLESAAWRDTPTAPFTEFKDIGSFAEGAPSLRCDRLYYQSVDGAGAGLFTAEW